MFFWFRRGREGGREEHWCDREHQLVASHVCPDTGSNPQPLGAQDDPPTDWVTWPGWDSNLLIIMKFIGSAVTYQGFLD